MTHRKQLCVIGLGQFGSELARNLAGDCEVLALDLDVQRVDEIADYVQRALVVDARDLEALRSTVSEDFDEAIVSMGEGLEASILCTLHLSRLGVRSIRAKAVTEDHASILRMVGASHVIFPERETARRVAAQIVRPNLVDYLPLEGEYLVQDVLLPDVFVGRSIGELRLRTHFNALVMAVRTQDAPYFVFLPSPDYVCSQGDVLVMIGRKDDLDALGATRSLPPLQEKR
ncbi:MAG: TrkA family potassium uptake protein [Actinobacteria bacterium]|nr:TrkA family potassium uptake protein [Actinomycetota bacterium]